MWQNQIRNQLRCFDPQLIGVTCMFTMSHQSFLDVCHHIWKYGIPLALGGVHVTNNLCRVIKEVPFAKFVFPFEADISFYRFIQVVNRDKNNEALDKVIFVDDGLSVFETGCTNLTPPSSDDISVIPEFDLVDIPNCSSYGVIGMAHFLKTRKPGGIATSLSNRGCRGKCKFCSVRSFNGLGVRHRSIGSVVDELELLHDRYHIGHVMWLDDDLLYNEKRAINLFDEIVKRRIEITWDATNGVVAKSVTDEVLAAAVESGCIALTVGVESGNKEILKSVNKPSTVESFLKAGVSLAKYPQLWLRTFLMIGFHGESISELKDTISIATQMNLDWNNITPLQILPGTELATADQSPKTVDSFSDVRYLLNNYKKSNDCSNYVALNQFLESDRKLKDFEINDVWFLVNYILNFRRIFSENRLGKQLMLIDYLEHIFSNVVFDHPLALYFYGYLKSSVYGAVPNSVMCRLQKKLAESEFWRNWFEILELDLEDLRLLRWPK